jgi:hypothetical protein
VAVVLVVVALLGVAAAVVLTGCHLRVHMLRVVRQGRPGYQQQQQQRWGLEVFFAALPGVIRGQWGEVLGMG